MAGEKQDEKVQDPGKVAKQAVADTDPKEDSPEFPVERLLGLDGYDLTGYPGYVLAGALHDVSKKNLTIEEAKAAAKAWLSAPVKEA